MPSKDKQFDEDYRKDIVEFIQVGLYDISEVAEELGISEEVVMEWVKEYGEDF
jgi:transposase-like protein